MLGALVGLSEPNFTLDDSWFFVEEDVCRRDFANEKGYVIDEARALLMAANRNVACAEGFARWLRGSKLRFNVSKKKKVRDGFSVRTKEAE